MKEFNLDAACLNNKQEFEGLNGFRESLGIAMWQEPPIDPDTLPKPFIPQDCDSYYHISNGDIIREWVYSESDDLDKNLAKNGQCFKTEEDAQKWLDFMKSMME